MLIDYFDPDDFSNKALAAVVEGLLNLEQQFVDKKQGQVLAGHLLSLSSTFREDQAPILKIIQSGNSKTPNRIRKKMVAVKRHNKPAPKYDKQGNCETCGKKTVSPKSATEGLQEPNDEHKVGGAPVELAELKAKTWREVLGTFGADVDSMRVFCTLNNISLGTAKKPEVIAKKIFKKLVDEGLA